MARKINNKNGETNVNKYNSKMTIIEYNGTNDITVEFENGYKTNSAYKEFKSGSISNPYDKSVYGYGYIGEGIYKSKTDEKPSIQYKYWQHMIERCYSIKTLEKYPTYKGCTVWEEWLNYQTFAKWFDENYYECNDGYVMDLDKDILNKGNKVYSPENCIFVSHKINSLFTKRQNDRGDYPIGVRYKKQIINMKLDVIMMVNLNIWGYLILLRKHFMTDINLSKRIILKKWLIIINYKYQLIYMKLCIDI